MGFGNGYLQEDINFMYLIGYDNSVDLDNCIHFRTPFPQLSRVLYSSYRKI